MANVAQPKQYISREKTPKWLHERNQSNTTRKMTEEEAPFKRTTTSI